MVLNGRLVRAIMMVGADTACVIGAKSFSESYGGFGFIWGARMVGPMFASSRVWPSGAALATIVAPIVPLAPGWFSMMTGWPSRWLSKSSIGRVIRSAGPPGGHGLMIFTTREG